MNKLLITLALCLTAALAYAESVLVETKDGTVKIETYADKDYFEVYTRNDVVYRVYLVANLRKRFGVL